MSIVISGAEYEVTIILKDNTSTQQKSLKTA